MQILEIRKAESNYFAAKVFILSITSDKITVRDAARANKIFFQADTIMPVIVSANEKEEETQGGKIYFTTVVLDCGKKFIFSQGHSIHKHLAKKEYSIHRDFEGGRYLKDETRTNFKHAAQPPKEFIKLVVELNLNTLKQIENFSLFENELNTQ